MRTKPPGLSALQVVYRGFPDATRYFGGHITRVRDISNPDGDRRDQLSARIRQSLARRMTAEQERTERHEAARQSRFAARRAAVLEGGSTEAPDLDLVLPALFQDEPAASPNSVSIGLTLPPPQVRAADISLIEITDDTTVRTRIFPRSVHCQHCGHFLVLDPERPPATLACPCCHQGHLVVEPIVFICGRCALVRELSPPAGRVAPKGSRRRWQPEQSLGNAPPCPDCLTGHIHLNKHGSNAVARWQWACTKCDQYREDVGEPCVACSLPSTATEPADVVMTQAIPASAANALQPLIHDQMFVGDEEIDVLSLRARARQQTSRWSDAFWLHEAVAGGSLSSSDLEALRASCLRDAYLVNNVRAFTTVYGYRASDVARHPRTPIDAADRLARLFLDREGLARFLAFCISTRGTALVLEFEASAIMERLASLDPGLDGVDLGTAVGRNADEIARTETRELLRVDGRALLPYRALHAVEHSLLNSAMRRIGSEALGSRLYLGAGTIVIFEKSPVGRGGVIQLANRGPGLMALFDAARDNVVGCAQGCQDGCPACIYVKDPYCSQPIEELRKDWVPPNSLLSRRGAAQILASGVP